MCLCQEAFSSDPGIPVLHRLGDEMSILATQDFA